MRVLFLLRSTNPKAGGVETATSNLATEFERHNCEVFVAAYSKHEDCPYKNVLLLNDADVAGNVALCQEFIQNGFKMEDYPMWIIMAQYGDFYCINQPLATYTLNFYSLSNHSTIAKTVEFEESTLEIKQFLALKYRYPIEQLILDSHYRSLLYIGLKYNDRQYVLEQFRNLKANKTYCTKDAIKHALFSTTIGFTFYKAKLCR